MHRRTYGEDPGALPDDAGVVIVEPVQGRAGARVPPDEFLPTLRERCDEAGALLVVDAIFTGLGRIGEMWPGSSVADVLCVGKALGGGLPLSAALFVRPELEQVWDLGAGGSSTRTRTRGNPLACAAALVVLDEVPKLLDARRGPAERFDPAGWRGTGPAARQPGSAAEAERAGVLVIPVPASEDGPIDPGGAAVHDDRRRARRGVQPARLESYGGGGPGGPGGGGASSSSTTVRRRGA